MTIENEAFIDIEQVLHNAVDQLWQRQWADIEKELVRLANSGDWETAYRIAQNIELTILVEEVEPLARTIAEASLFLGASRVNDPENASFYGAPDETLIEIGVKQWSAVLMRNATIALQTEAEIQLGLLEAQFQEDALKRIVKADPNLGKVGRQGTQFSRAAASLMISRMSTAGFMIEASAKGIQQYRVSEVMDSATCPVCSLMHNKTYPVAAGLALSNTIMQATDPESLKAVSPFPSQSAANVKAMGKMSQGALIGAGMNLPPYHPYCRGIATLESKNSRASALASGAIAPGYAMTGTGDLTSEQLGARMFGDFDEADGALLDSLLGIGGGAAFGVGDPNE